MAANDRGKANVNRYGELHSNEHPVFNSKREIKDISETVSIAVAAYTDTSVAKFPANCWAEAVAWYVKTAIPGLVSNIMDIGNFGTANAYADDVATTKGASGVKHLGVEITSETAIRITPNDEPTAGGEIIIQVFYRQITQPTAASA